MSERTTRLVAAIALGDPPGGGVGLGSILADAVEPQQPHVADGLTPAVRVVGHVPEAAEDQLADHDPIVLPDDRPGCGEGPEPFHHLADALEEVLDPLRLTFSREPLSVSSDILEEVLVHADAPPPHSASPRRARTGAPDSGGVAGHQIVERGFLRGPIEDRLRDRPGARALPLLRP